jgi:hypothetical protein
MNGNDELKHLESAYKPTQSAPIWPTINWFNAPVYSLMTFRKTNEQNYTTSEVLQYKKYN